MYCEICLLGFKVRHTKLADVCGDPASASLIRKFLYMSHLIHLYNDVKTNSNE